MKKRISKLMIACLCLATLSFGCASAKAAKGTTTLKAKDISFKSEDGSLTITNDTSSDVVIFVGKVQKDTQIGGIKANQTRSFNLEKIPGIPKHGSLLIRAATVESYKNKKTKITEEDVIYTGLVVFDFNDPGHKTKLNLFSGVDTSQKKCIYVSNESEFFVLELRQGTPSGEAIATLAPLETNKPIFMTAKEDGTAYDFYPEYIYVNPETNEKTSISAGKTERRRAVPEAYPAKRITPLRFEAPSSGKIGYDVAFVTVQNDTSMGLEFRNGETTLGNQNGIKFTQSGRSDVYELDSLNGDIGQIYTGLKCEFDNFEKLKILPEEPLYPGYKYEIIITDINGNLEYDFREVGKKSFLENSRIQLFND